MSGPEERIVIIGGLGTGQILMQAVRDLAGAGAAISCAGFLNDVVPAGEAIDGVPVLGRFDAWADLPPATLFITGILKAKEAPARRARIESLGIPDARYRALVHPTATVAASATIGAGTYIGPNVAVMPHARVGRHVSVRANAYVSHDVVVEDFAFVGPNASLNGRSVLGRGAHLGPNAVLADGVRVGADAVVGIGSAAARDVAPGTVALGVPARFAGRVDGGTA